MTNSMDILLDKLISYYQALRKAFKWDHQMIHQLGALTLISEGKELDIDGIRSVRKMIKSNSGIFSQFRGINELLLAIMLYSKDDSNERYDSMRRVYDLLREKGFRSSLYLPTSALVIVDKVKYDHSDPSKDDNHYADRMKAYYDGMKKHHFWLTGQENYLYAAILSISGLPVDETIEEMERFYTDLNRDGFSRGSALQNLTHVLVLGQESYDTKKDKVKTVQRFLKDRGYNLRHYQMPFLGVLAMMSSSPEELAEKAIDLERKLQTHRGFGSFSIDKKTRFVLAASLAGVETLNQETDQISQSVLTNSVQAMILAQQAATIAAVVAVSGASGAAATR